jgi:hypothetical protein
MALASQVMASLLLAGLLVSFAHRLVTRHLDRIAAWSREQAGGDRVAPLGLDRRRTLPDELDLVVDALNAMRGAVHEELAARDLPEAARLVRSLLGGDERGPCQDMLLLNAAMATRGIEPATIADKATLIRRASFDLTGLPPAPEEIDAFLADESPDAFTGMLGLLSYFNNRGSALNRPGSVYATLPAPRDGSHILTITTQKWYFPKVYLPEDFIVDLWLYYTTTSTTAAPPAPAP